MNQDIYEPLQSDHIWSEQEEQSRLLTPLFSEKDIFDLLLPLSVRFSILQKLRSDRQYECVKRLLDIYRINGVKKLEKFFKHVCIYDTTIPLCLKIDMLDMILRPSSQQPTPSDSRAFSTVLFLTTQKAITTSSTLDTWLMVKDLLVRYFFYFKEECERCVRNVITIKFGRAVGEMPKTSAKVFNQIFELIVSIKNKPFLERSSLWMYTRFRNKLYTKEKLTLLQIIFDERQNAMDSTTFDQTRDLSVDPFKLREGLIAIAKDKNEPLSSRLEACDILSLKGSPDTIRKVKDILAQILPDEMIYNNDENVHLSSIDASVHSSLITILNKNKCLKPPKDLYQHLSTHFETRLTNQPDMLTKIQVVLNRIFNFNFLKFTKLKLTLKEILEQIWLIIDVSIYKEELMIRLEQELLDMYDTCSQGFVTRLINVLSGFGDELGIRISYEDQIYAIFATRVNDLVKDAPEAVREVLLEEMLVPTNEPERRVTLMRYLRPHLSQIWNGIFESFGDVLSAIDLDLYCRKVTMRYEGC